jgi:hypothetical protein
MRCVCILVALVDYCREYFPSFKNIYNNNNTYCDGNVSHVVLMMRVVRGISLLYLNKTLQLA